jgi:hypothetical protein
MLKPVPLGVMDEIVNADPPLLVSVSERVLLDAVATFPKPKLVGLAPTVPAVTPDPLNGMLNVGLVPLLTMASVPFTAPPVWGANLTETVALWLAFKVVGNARPLML